MYCLIKMSLFAVLLMMFVAGTSIIRPLGAAADLGQNNGSVNLFVRSASENADQSAVTLPLFKGTNHGHTVYYVILDSSNRADAAVRQVNYAPKLANAKGTPAVQQIHLMNGLIDFPGTVDFSPTHILIPGPIGFPPNAAQPGAVGDALYSPFIEMPDGTVLNAPQIANADDPQQSSAATHADKVIAIDYTKMQVVYRETEGRYDNRVVHYLSFDSSFDVAAAIEDVTYAPNLHYAPALGDESHASAREGLLAFTNGQLGVTNPQRQGLNSALLDGLAPLNILHEVPEGQSDPGFPVYSPLWDIHLVQWTSAAITSGQNTRQADFGTVLNLGAQGLVVAFPSGGPIAASGFVVNCPIISMNPSK